MISKTTGLLARALPALLLLLATRPVFAEAPRALPPGQLPNDVRLQPLKDLDGYFPFHPPATREEWDKRSEYVRRRLQVSLGLWPMPEKTPLNPVIHGKLDRGDYTVEKVHFESVPGFFVTGNLYRPKNATGKIPGVLFAHGHWNNGRFYDAGEEGVKQEIIQGAERFGEGGRSLLQSLCVGMVRAGCVVFQYDMLGYADSIQIPMAITHNFAKQRPEMNTTNGWGLYSPQAEAHLQSVMGLQSWNSIRSLDFLTSLPDVDAERVACTGASGGGTQTFILGALDARVKVAFPAVMVSTAMQGGCTCENACLLRVETGNVEFAGLFAPKPLGLTSANDWTREMATKGFPDLQQLYGLMGASQNVMLKRGEHFGHNYNYVSRAAMYSWMNKHLRLGLKEPYIEENYQRLTEAEMTVWDDAHPKPPGGPDFERQLLLALTADANRQLGETLKDEAKFQNTVGGAVDIIIGRNLSQVGEIEWSLGKKTDQGKSIEMTGLVKNKTHGEEVPVVFHYPKEWNGQTVIWVTGQGKQALYEADGSLQADLKKLVDGGATVVGVDLLYQGEFTTNSQPITRTGKVKNPREAAAYTFGYNHTVFAQRVHDLLSVIQFIKTHERPSKRLDIVGLDGAGPLVAAARAQSGGAIDRAVIDTAGFRFGQVLDIHSPDFLPGGAKYGDLPGFLALGKPGNLHVAGETEQSLALVKARYALAPGKPKFTLAKSKTLTSDAAVRWLTGKGE